MLLYVNINVYFVNIIKYVIPYYMMNFLSCFDLKQFKFKWF